MDRSSRWNAAIPLAGILLFLGVVVGIGQLVPVPDLVDWLRERTEAIGPVLGPALFVAVYVGATFLAVPGTPLTLLAGALFGTWRGLVVMVVASGLSASLMFLFARHVFRGFVERRIRGVESVRRVERLLEEKGPLAVAASRLVPVFPFLWLNYAWGLTRVPSRTYVVWSLIGMLPLNLVHIVLGQSAAEALAGDLPFSTQVTLGIALAAAALAIVVAYRFLRSREPRD